jgi:carboxypeptidase Taq
MGIHESQARLWENMVGRSRPFWTFWLRRLREHFPDAVRGIELDAFLAEVNRVRNDLVRISADEVSYNLHVLMRFRLEVGLFEGALEARDLPAAWNEESLHLFGRVPKDDLEGCLQDVHWALGSFGYFPSYAIGNLYAAQLYDAWLAERRDAEECLARGETAPLLGFLRDKVHRFGHLHPAEELARRATGRGLSVEPFVGYLQRKYGG